MYFGLILDKMRVTSLQSTKYVYYVCVRRYIFKMKRCFFFHNGELTPYEKDKVITLYPLHILELVYLIAFSTLSIIFQPSEKSKLSLKF